MLTQLMEAKMVDDNLRKLDQRARRLAKRCSLSVFKSRSKHGFYSLDYSGPPYMVCSNNTVVDYGTALEIIERLEDRLKLIQ